jgi:hypothetical protein
VECGGVAQISVIKRHGSVLWDTAGVISIKDILIGRGVLRAATRVSALGRVGERAVTRISVIVLRIFSV